MAVSGKFRLSAKLITPQVIPQNNTKSNNRFSTLLVLLFYLRKWRKEQLWSANQRLVGNEVPRAGAILTQITITQKYICFIH